MPVRQSRWCHGLSGERTRAISSLVEESRSTISKSRNDQSFGCAAMIASHCSTRVATTAGIVPNVGFPPMDQATLERLADLAVTVGANVQPGQIVCVTTDVDRIPLSRAVADRAYRAGARHVEVVYGDPWLQRSRIEHGSDDSIGFAPSWQIDRLRAMGEQQVATIRLEGGFDPAALDGLD